MRAFETWDGLEIAYYVWGEAPVGDASLPPVVLHHGFVANAEANWVALGVVDRLRTADRCVIAPDARGHGRSEKPHDPARYGEQLMARDLGVLVELLDLPLIDLVGYSMGAVVSLLYASATPRVRRLVVGGVGSGVVECGGVDRRAVSNDAIMAALRAEDSAELAALDPQAAAFRTLADALDSDREALVAQASSIHRAGVPLERIEAPTLLLAGDGDPLAIRPRVLAEAIPHATLRMLVGNHVGALGDPRFTDSILEFLSER